MAVNAVNAATLVFASHAACRMSVMDEVRWTNSGDMPGPIRERAAGEQRRRERQRDEVAGARAARTAQDSWGPSAASVAASAVSVAAPTAALPQAAAAAARRSCVASAARVAGEMRKRRARQGASSVSWLLEGEVGKDR